VARRIAVSPRFLVASPTYLAGHGHPKRPEDLPRHDYVRFAWADTGGALTLHRTEENVQVEMRGRYRVNHAVAIREALELGAGIGLCPEWLVHDLLAEGRLLPVLPDWSAGHQELYVLYPSRRYQPSRAKQFIAFMEDRVLALPGFQKPATASLFP
jgi:DNA-binding transcriptional LysR family regulator